MSISCSKINNIHLNNNLNFTIALSTIASTIATTAASASVSMNGGLSNLDDVAKTTWDNTTSKDAFKSYAISALTAGATQGITNVLNNMTNGAITAGNASNATLTQKFTTALYESAISTTTNTAVQSAINGDSFKDILKQQAINTGVGAIANLGAKEIGGNFKNGNINKIEQLTLHAGLGAITNKLTGNDALSGAVSGLIGEVIGEFAGNKMYGTTDGSKFNQQQKNVLKEIGGLSGVMSSIFVGSMKDLDDKDIANNMFAGQRVGQNAVENNLVAEVARNLDNKLTELDIDNGKHSYIVVKPDKPEDFTDDKMKERGLDPNKFKFINLGNNEKGIIIGGYEINGNLEIGINQMTDYKTTIALNYNIDTPFNPEVRIIKSVNGMTDSQFIYSIMKNSNNYLNNQLNGLKVKYNIAPKVMPGYNCNSFSNSLLDYSGGDLNRNKDFNGIDWGINSKIPRYYFNNNK